jgi:predicted nucleic acid-binding protein
LFGIGLLPRAERNFREWERIKYDFEYYSVDQVDAEQSAHLRLALRQRGRQIGIIDSFIAVIALRNDLVLLTSDQDFSAVSNLKQENWRVP